MAISLDIQNFHSIQQGLKAGSTIAISAATQGF